MIRRLFRKLNITKVIIAALVLLVFAMPAIITIGVLKRNDAVDAKREAYEESIKAMNKPDKIKPDPARFEDISEEPVTAVSSVEEISTLTSAEPEATAGDATESDAFVEEATENDAAEEEEALSEVHLNGKRVYLTFDDGPSDTTEELLDVLDEYDVKATFFVVVNDFEHKAELRDIVKRGHTLGLHSNSHVYSKIYADLDSFINDVESVRRWVKAITGVDTKYYRFPGGSSNNVSDVSMSDCIDYLNENGYTYFDWNAESRDAEDLSLSTDALVENTLSYVRNNEGDSIVLMHDLDEHYNTVLALPRIIEGLRSEGYEICTLSEESPKCHHRDE
ncbi:MAG: polysaccharide deacetylase [Eubacterium sp.]|nr:polysaccharide deacetylase [Eubacterium sp.]